MIKQFFVSGDVWADSIQPKDYHVFAEEGTEVYLYCNYSTTYTTAYYLHWYRQYDYGGPQFILHKANKGSSSKAAVDRFESEVNSSSTVLIITDLKLEDTATYHCALAEATVR
ncbi:hypothetical protein XELAEV_18007252mg [Xenopus laevis]|uniref:Ig-like domain-containing protein n=1 Tax=Xenopus laevis TaxID=8355 RepID=A0A974E1E4_XENLA|nr:hypothetical protein XELAEV_18007252mg [Xenopus laevis]